MEYPLLYWWKILQMNAADVDAAHNNDYAVDDCDEATLYQIMMMELYRMQ